MTKAEQARIVGWRLRILLHAAGEPRQDAPTCRYFGISRTAFYHWKKRFEEFGEAGLADRPRTPRRSPRATSAAMVSKILYLRQNYHFGAGRIAAYLQRFYQVEIARSTAMHISPTLRCAHWSGGGWRVNGLVVSFATRGGCRVRGAHERPRIRRREALTQDLRVTLPLSETPACHGLQWLQS